jgi:hypothetical protein
MNPSHNRQETRLFPQRRAESHGEHGSITRLQR